MTEWMLDLRLLYPGLMEEVDLNLVLSVMGRSVNNLLEAQACFISNKVSLATHSRYVTVVENLLHRSRLSIEFVLIISWKICKDKVL